MRGEKGKHENVVIVKNLFEKETFDNDVSLLLEYQKDLRDECSKCGVVKKVVVYDVSIIESSLFHRFLIIIKIGLMIYKHILFLYV